MDWVAPSMIIGYLAVITAVGAWSIRRSKSSKDWAVAGGGMGIVMIAMGVAGTRIGGAGTYGVAGDVITEGLWNLWYGVSTFLALAVVGLMFAIPYRRLELQTVGEIFRLRYGSSRCQWLTSLCVQTEYIIVNIIEPFVIGKILQGVFEIPFGLGVAIGALVIITYTTAGGLWGSAITNFIHCSVILGGLFTIGMVGVNEMGGWDNMRETVSETLRAAGQDDVAWWSIAGAGWGAVIGMIFSAVIHTPAASVYVNFSSAAKSEKSLIPAFLLGGLIGALMPFLAAWVGMIALAKYGADAQLTSYRSITELAASLHPWIGGLSLAAILAAVISSGGPILLSSATMFVRDWLPFTRDKPMDVQLVFYRGATIGIGILAAVIAYVGDVTGAISSILDLLLFGFAVVVPPAIAVGYLIYWRGTTETGCFWGIALGYAGGMFWYAMIKIAAAVDFEAGPDAGAFMQLLHTCFVYRGDGIDPSYATTIIPLVIVPVVSWFTKRVEGHPDLFYEVVRGKGDPAALRQ